MSTTGPSRQRLMSNRPPNSTYSTQSKGKENATNTPFEPCAATASLFLYAEGSTVVCLHHDSLAVERKFHKHTENIQFICVDNVSERGQGRLVVTYDVGKTAIVWDLFTGEQISRFASYEPLTVAAWMRNGNLTFGNEKGEVILFEPPTSEHVSARTIFDPITAIAPSSDCKTYAIGYRNGSILLAALQPTFTILHTLTTARAPSPIASLTWHSSSSKQKSDMLATNTIDGDLRVWSVAKPPISTAPRVIRSLRHAEPYSTAKHWISWSRNGRILQFTDGEAWAWDVRTKDVTYETIPLVDPTKGIAAYGPSGTLFTIGQDYTIQQYDVDSAQMVANVRHMPATIPQTPPQDFSPPVFTSESEEDVPARQSKLNVYVAEAAKLERNRSRTPQSVHSRDDSSDSVTKVEMASPASKTDWTTTTISIESQSGLSKETYSPTTNKSGRKGSRLRQELLQSPEERPVAELFPYIRSRLTDVPYKQPGTMDESTVTPDRLRQQMLNVVFGWEDDIQALITDELARLPADSSHAAYLSGWLKSSFEDIAEAISSSKSSVGADWIRLALSNIASSQEAKQVAQVFVEKMLTVGDIHAAVAVLLASGDHDDAIEVYVSRNRYMEAVLLTCLLMPTDWQRQSYLVRKWGEHAVRSEKHLAVRCFSCTGVEPADPWTSPRAQMAATMSPVAPMLQPSIYHKTLERRGLQENQGNIPTQALTAPSRNASNTGPRTHPQSSGLKLVTSFAGKDQFKFPGLMSDEGTPINAALATPIAESAAPRSALSPGGVGSYRMNNIRSLNTALASRNGTPNPLPRHRLPSIGETPIDVEAPQSPLGFTSRAPPTPADSGSDKEREGFYATNMENQKLREELPLLLTPARYEPPSFPARQTPKTAVAVKTSLPFANDAFSEDQQEIPTIERGSSPSKKPSGLSIQMFPANEDRRDEEQTSAAVYGESIDRPSTSESANSMQFDSGDLASPLYAGNSYNSYRSMKSPSTTGRSLDQYISSLEQAQYYKNRSRGNSISSKQSRDEVSDRKKSRQREQVGEIVRGRDDTQNMKRSPSPPVPLHPEDLRSYSKSVESFEAAYMSSKSANQSRQTIVQYGEMEARPSSASVGERRKQRSRSRQPEAKSRGSSRTPSRRPSPDRRNRDRGRSKSRRDDSTIRSPSSPEPMLPSEEDRLSTSSIDPALRFVSRNRNRLNSGSIRRKERNGSKQRQTSPERKSQRLRSSSRQPEALDTTLGRRSSLSTRADRSRRRAESSVDLHRDSREEMTAPSTETTPHSSRPDFERPKTSHGQSVAAGRRTKELAQAELEARRLSLARRPSAPAVPFPGQNGSHNKSVSVDLMQPPPLLRAHTDTGAMSRSTLSPHPNNPEANPFARSRPATPRAMKHPNHQSSSAPDLPGVGELLSSTVYKPPRNAETSNYRNQGVEIYLNPEIPYDMPKHPAFDANIGTSRPTSRGVVAGRRNNSQERGISRERNKISAARDVQVMTIGEEEYNAAPTGYAPPVVPELQHLALPPPPPPPPAPPKDTPPLGNLRIQTSDLNSLPTSIPLPLSAYPGETPLSAISPADPGSARHRRGRSGNENQIVGKIRNFAGRMRSTSRGRSNSRSRDNNTKSPNGNSDDAYSPYETVVQNTQQAHQQLATVIEGR